MMRIAIALISLATAVPVSALEINWTRGTGQYRCEATPVIVDSDGDGNLELLTINVGGQLMHWNVNGSQKGPGQDGTVAELPKGEWSSAPLAVETRNGMCFVVGNNDGLLVCFDASYKQLWTYQLPGKTQWSRAVPAVLASDTGPLLCIGDHTGAVTCLRTDGSLVWSKAFGSDPIRTYLTSFTTPDGAQRLLIAAGQVLHCVDAVGTELWAATLGGEPAASGLRPTGNLLAKPEVFTIDSSQRIVCANGTGRLLMFDIAGSELWHADAGAEIDASIMFWEEKDAPPLIVCTGVWGDVFAFNVDGQPAWRHAMRSKNRAKPLVADTNHDGKTELVVAAYNQHIYAFDREGRCVDDLRLSGSVNASPILVPDTNGAPDIYAISTALLAHRISPSMPHGIYGQAEGNGQISVANDGLTIPATIVIHSAANRLLRVNVFSELPGIGRYVFSRLSSADVIAVSAPDFFNKSVRGQRKLRVEVTAADGTPHIDWETTVEAVDAPSTKSRVYAALPYALNQSDTEISGFSPRKLEVGPIYRGEIDQGAFAIENSDAQEVPMTIVLSSMALEDGTQFSGELRLNKVVAVPSLNQEKVLDAIVPLTDRSVRIPANDTAYFWILVDPKQTTPGTYRGVIGVTGFVGETDVTTLPVSIDVDSLQLPSEQPLTMCTWDYVPNKWFPENTPAVLDDMQRHGVNVFPRTTVPPAKHVGTSLTMDWTTLDAELARIEGRGHLLLQLAEPPIEFAQPPTPEDKRRIQCDYIRAVRDHLREKGRGYDQFALYPVDEPGLDYGGNAQRMVDYGQLFREADPQLRIYTDPVPGLSQRDYVRIAPLIDVWCPNMRMVTGLLVKDARIADIMNSGKPVWSYECVSEVRALSPLRYNRSNAWRADYFGLDGIGFWTHSTTQVDPWIADHTKNDEYALVYPGDIPVSSIRWEAARDGIEDIGAIRVLEAALKAASEKDANSDAVKLGYKILRMARIGVMEMADEAYVESRDFLQKGDRTILNTPWDAVSFLQYRRYISDATHALSGEGTVRPES